MSKLSLTELESLLLNENESTTIAKMIPKSENLEYVQLLIRYKKKSEDWSILCKDMENFMNNSSYFIPLRNKINLLKSIRTYQNSESKNSKRMAVSSIASLTKVNQLPMNIKGYMNHSLYMDINDDNSSLKNDSKPTVTFTSFENFLYDPTKVNFSKEFALEAFNYLDFSKLCDKITKDAEFFSLIIENLELSKWNMIFYKNFYTFFKHIMELSTNFHFNIKNKFSYLFTHLPFSWLEPYKSNDYWGDNKNFLKHLILKRCNCQIEEIKELSLEDLEEVKEFLYQLNDKASAQWKFIVNLEILNRFAEKEEFPKELFLEMLKALPKDFCRSEGFKYSFLKKKKNIKLNVSNLGLQQKSSFGLVPTNQQRGGLFLTNTNSQPVKYFNNQTSQGRGFGSSLFSSTTNIQQNSFNIQNNSNTSAFGSSYHPSIPSNNFLNQANNQRPICGGKTTGMFGATMQNNTNINQSLFKKPCFPNTSNKPDQRKKISINPKDLNSKIKKIISTTLNYYFKNSSEFPHEWTEYFEEDHLRGAWIEQQLLLGLKPENFETIISEKRLGVLVRKEILELKNNPSKFSSDEEVKLILKIKNISQLIIRVFHINMENVLLQNESVDFSKMNIDGLLPSEEIIKKFEIEPLKEFNEEFTFDIIKNQNMGVFLIDFLGGKLTARAIINKGQIYLRRVKKSFNLIYNIFDHKNKICKGERTGIYLDKKFYKANEKGEICIPKDLKKEEKTIIFCHNKFASTQTINSFNPKYKLSIHVLFTPEQYQANKMVDVFLLPKLEFDNEEISLDRLTNFKIKVILNFESGENKTIEFKNTEKDPKKINIKDGQFTKVSFFFQPQIKNMIIQLKASQKKEKDVKLVANHNVNFTNSKFRKKTQIYLNKKNNKNYIISARGRNGEPIKNQPIQLHINSKRQLFPFKNTIHTDTSGTCDLSLIKNFDSLFAYMDDRPDSRIQTCKDHSFFYTKHAFMIKGEILKLPVEDVKNFSIVRGVSGKDILSEENFRTVEIIENDNENYVSQSEHMIILKNLEQGYYIIKAGRSHEEFIHLKVLDGERIKLANKDVIRTAKWEIELPHRGRFWRIIDQESSKLKLIKGEIVSNLIENEENKMKEILLIGNNFIRNITSFVQEINQKCTQQKYCRVYKLNKTSNKYLNNKTIEKEVLYIQKRKKLKAFMGVSLEKPSILLKRTKLNNTKEINKKDEKIQDFEKIEKNQPEEKLQFFNQKPEKVNFKNQIDLNNEFLTNPGIIRTFDLELDQWNKSNIKDEVIMKYNHVVALVNLGDGLLLTKTLKNEFQEPQKKDITLQDSGEKGFIYKNVRDCLVLEKNQIHKMNKDQLQKDFKIISSMPELFKIFIVSNSNLKDSFKRWEFLPMWSSLSILEKLKKYNEFFSNELNLFCYFKDPEFFHKVIKPFISNKRKKHVIDHFLLENKQILRKYLSIGMFSSLDFYEKILVLVMCRNDPRALTLLNGLKFELQPAEKDRKIYIFDKIIDNDIITKPEGDDNQGFFKKKRGLFSTKVPKQSDALFSSNANPFGQAPQQSQNILSNMINNQNQPIKTMNNSLFENTNGQKKNEVKNSFGFKSSALFSQPITNNNKHGGGLFGTSAKNTGFSSSNDQQYEANTKLSSFDKEKKKNDPTIEYCEKHFYFNNVNFTKLHLYERYISHVIKNDSIKNFVDPDFALATMSPTEALFILSIIDVPFISKEPIFKNNLITLDCNGLLYWRKFIKKKAVIENSEILISQKFYQKKTHSNQMFFELKNENHPITEFVKGEVYECRVVITNCSRKDESLNLITEIPKHSISLSSAETLQSLPITIPSYQSKVANFFFYFPKSGEFEIYPACITRGDVILAIANIDKNIKVNKKYEDKQFFTMMDVQLRGTIKDYFEFLEKIKCGDNILFFKDLSYILCNKDHWKKTITILRKKGIFNNYVWKYGVLHYDIQTIREYFQYSIKRIEGINYMSNELINIDSFYYSDFYPLHNSRAHSKNPNKENIMNIQFKKKYMQFLNYLFDKKYLGEIKNDDWIVFITYLLLQDRIEEAINIFEKVKASEKTDPITLGIQRDYVEAYLDFLIGYPEFTKSRSICVKYLSYPVLAWRNLFVEIANQLAEFEEEDFESDFNGNKNISTLNKEKESSFLKAYIKDDSIVVKFKNQEKIYIEYYLTDLEILFSEDPFEDNTELWMAKVMPSKESFVPLDLSGDLCQKNILIHEDFKMKNVFIRITNDAYSINLKHIPKKFTCTVYKDLNMIKILEEESGKPIPKIYVKCYAKYDFGEVSFMKDGYTDLRGSFEYLFQIKKELIQKIKSFSILVISEEYGAKILRIKSSELKEKVIKKSNKIFSRNWRDLGSKNAANNVYSQAIAGSFK